MPSDSEIIRTEIIRVLNENGKTRGGDLVDRVIKKVGNEKTVYREISSLVESGQIEKRIHDKSHIEYELINLSESVSNQLKTIHNELETSLTELKKFFDDAEETRTSYHQKIRTVIDFIHMVQSIEGIMRLLSYYPTFKKDRMFSQINRKVNDYWEAIMSGISRQPEEEFFNEVLANMRISEINPENVN